MTLDDIKLLEQNNIIPKGCPPEQVQFFAKICEKKKLDPFQRQIHLVERKSKDNFGNWVKSYTIQAGIDGMRAIAQRNAKILSYKRWVEKRDDDLYGICEINTEDRGKYYDELPFKEYAQKTKDGPLNSFWAKFPQTMIKKCAEESVLRMMTPEDLSGVYGDDEMMQADEETKPKALLPLTGDSVTTTMPEALNEGIRDLSEDFKNCKNINQVNKLWETLNEDEKAKYKVTKQLREIEIGKANIKVFIAKLDNDNFSKNQFFIEEIIDSEKGSKRTELVKFYNDRLNELGIQHQLKDDLPF